MALASVWCSLRVEECEQRAMKEEAPSMQPSNLMTSD
jgi:hypothetical protein